MRNMGGGLTPEAVDQAVLAALRRIGGAVVLSAIAIELNNRLDWQAYFAFDEVSASLRRLKAAGRVECVKRRYWQPLG